MDCLSINNIRIAHGQIWITYRYSNLAQSFESVLQIRYVFFSMILIFKLKFLSPDEAQSNIRISYFVFLN